MLSASLMRNFFQLGYVTPDLDQAVALYRARFGVGEFLTFDSRDMHPDQSNYVKVGLAWLGEVMIELIEPVGDHPRYARAMPEQGFGIRLHHLGYRVPDQAGFNAALKDLENAGVPIEPRTSSSEPFSIAYADARETLGHYVEIIWTTARVQALFDSVPRN